MIVLGVETSGPVGSLALLRDGRCLEERFLPELGRRHARSLVPEVVSLLVRHEIDPGDVRIVAVGIGPGSFTGLRVGVTFAKTFAYAAAAELAAVETFEAIAANTPSAREIAVLADAQRGGLILGRYTRDGEGRLRRQGDPRLVPVGETLELIAADTLLSGPGVWRLPMTDRPVAPEPYRTAKASVVARLGEAAVNSGRAADPWTLEPLYVRKSGAEEKRDAEVAAGKHRPAGRSGSVG